MELDGIIEFYSKTSIPFHAIPCLSDGIIQNHSQSTNSIPMPWCQTFSFCRYHKKKYLELQKKFMSGTTRYRSIKHRKKFKKWLLTWCHLNWAFHELSIFQNRHNIPEQILAGGCAVELELTCHRVTQCKITIHNMMKGWVVVGESQCGLVHSCQVLSLATVW